MLDLHIKFEIDYMFIYQFINNEWFEQSYIEFHNDLHVNVLSVELKYDFSTPILRLPSISKIGKIPLWLTVLRRFDIFEFSGWHKGTETE